MAKDPYDVLDLKGLRCFWATGRLGSLTKAGIELGISEAAISQRLKALESRLGVKLYESRGGKVRLTRAGENTLAMAVRMFDELAEFEAAVSSDEALGEISLSSHEPILRYVLPDIFQAFKNKYPLAKLKILGRPFKETVQLVISNEVDLGIVPKSRSSKQLEFHPLLTSKAYLLIPHGHPLLLKGSPDIRELLKVDLVNRYPLIIAEQDEPDHKPIREVLEKQQLPYNVFIEAGTVDTVKHYVAEGHGIGVTPGLCLTDEDAGKFVSITIPDDLWSGTTYGVIIRSDKHRTEPLSHLLSLIERRTD
ncbi:MAG: LysR family transcriptional regulator [Pseudomonadales bacterium]